MRMHTLIHVVSHRININRPHMRSHFKIMCNIHSLFCVLTGDVYLQQDLCHQGVRHFSEFNEAIFVNDVSFLNYNGLEKL
jgi:hypothetical protein